MGFLTELSAYEVMGVFLGGVALGCVCTWAYMSDRHDIKREDIKPEKIKPEDIKRAHQTSSSDDYHEMFPPPSHHVSHN